MIIESLKGPKMSKGKGFAISKDNLHASWGNVPISAKIFQQIQAYLLQRQSIGLWTDVDELISTATDEFRDFQQRPDVKAALELVCVDLASDLAFAGLSKDEMTQAIVINFAIANYLNNCIGKWYLCLYVISR